MMINLLLPGFLTKGLSRLKLLRHHTPALFRLGLPSHHHPKSLKTLVVFLIAQQWEGREMLGPRLWEKQGPWRPVHLGSVTSALVGVNSTLQLPLPH